MEKLDQIDKHILELLQLDAKLNVKQIASKIGLTTTPTYERIKRLERDGIIKKYIAVLDHRKIGKSLEVLCNVSLSSHSKEKIKKFEEEISRIDDVMNCYHVTGDADYLLKILVSDIDEYQLFLRHKLSVLDNVVNVRSVFVMTNVKSDSVVRL